MSSRLLKLPFLFILASFSSLNAATLTAAYKGKNLQVIAAERTTPIVLHKNSEQPIRKPKLSLETHGAKLPQVDGATLNSAHVYYDYKKTMRELIIDIEIESSTDLPRCFFAIVTHDDKPEILVQELPKITAGTPYSASFTLPTGTTPWNKPFTFAAFSGEKAIALKDHSQSISGTIVKLREFPSLLVQATPRYPEDLREQGIGARVQLIFTITETGDVIDVEVLDSPHESFSKNAISAIEKSKYQPAKLKGNPVSARIKQWVQFTP